MAKGRNRTSAAGTVPPEASPKHHRWLAWVPLAALALGAIYFAYPKYSAHRRADFSHDVNDLIDVKVNPLHEKLDKMSDDLADMKGKLQILEPVVQELIARKLSQSVTLPEKDFLASLPALRDVVRTGIEAKVQVDPTIVGEATKRAVAISAAHPNVWPVATDLLGYRSFLIARQAPEITPAAAAAPPSSG